MPKDIMATSDTNEISLTIENEETPQKNEFIPGKFWLWIYQPNDSIYCIFSNIFCGASIQDIEDVLV